MVVTDALNSGGAERVAVDIANSLDRSRYRASFCATRAGGPLEQRLSSDVELDVLGRLVKWDARKLVTFGRITRRRNISIIHSHGRGTMKFVSLAKALGLVDAKHVFHDHFGWLHLDRGAGVGLREAMRREVDQYLGVDHRLCRWAEQQVGFPSDRVHLVRSGVDIGRFVDVEPVDVRAMIGARADDTIVAMAANFRSQKDHPLLFRAMALLDDDVLQRMQVVIMGATHVEPDYFRGCMDMVERLGIGDRIHLLGERDDIPRLLAGCDFAVLCSKNETGPLVVLEYMASGLPFVATETGEITSAVHDRGVGLVTAPRDDVEMADALTEMMRMDPTRRRAMGRTGQRLASSTFSQESVTREIEAVYRTLL
ncbi:MAG: glycosyltransferase family 4 protein [Microthrixaceae bacterium]